MTMISDSNVHSNEALLDKAADYLCREFYPEAFEAFKNDPEHFGFTCLDNDVNFMLYSFVLACQFRFQNLMNYNDVYKFMVKRPDGGNFIAFAHAEEDVKKTNGGKDDYPYWACGYMTRDSWCATPEEMLAHDCAFQSISLDCRYTNRSGDWSNNHVGDWEALVRFIVRGKDSLAPEEYKRIVDIGYVYGDMAQPVIFRAKLAEGETLSYSAIRLLEKKMPLSEELIKFSKKLDEEAFDIIKNDYPEHMLPAIKSVNCTAVISQNGVLPRVIERLIEGGMLKPLTEIQRKAALAILEIK